ncbi:MAG: putative Protein TonB, partial [Nitrospira sp.]|nr:putative Protein TonB [Nitrospira sp.]
EMTLPPTPETFKWDVAMVQSPAPPEEPVATPPPPVEQPPPPVQPPLPKPQPVRTPSPKNLQPVKAEPVVQAPEPMQEIQPVQEAVPLQTAQAIQQAQQQVETVTRPVQEDVQPTPEVTPAVTRTETAVEKTEAVEQRSVAVEPVVTAATTPLTAAVTPMPSPVTERSGVEESQVPVETPQQVEQTVTARAIPEVQQRAVVQHLSVRTRPTTKPDYGWLSQALWSTVEQRKRYPPEARRNRWEGKVILKLTIEQRGAAIHLLDVSLEESSGHSALDRHTLDIVRNAFPLNVKHILAQQHVQLHLPFSYRME